MVERLLTPAEIDRLKAAGIVYPWSPRQSLMLLNQIVQLQAENKRLRVRTKEGKNR